MRGRLTAIYGVKKGVIKQTPFLHNSLFSCTLCGLCEVECPPGVKSIEVMEALRSDVTSILGFNPPHERLLSNLRVKGHPYSDPIPLKYHITKQESEIAYFPGCTAIFRLPHIIQKTLTILRMISNSEVALLHGCCGGIAKRIGALEIFNDVKHRIEELLNNSEIKELIVTCAGCYSTLTKYYSLGKIKVKHISVFLCDFSNLPFKQSMKGKVAYHDPCHLGRHSNIYEEPRHVITNLAKMELVEFKDNREKAVCCGGGGGLMSAFRELAEQIAFNKLKQLSKLNVSRLVTACPFCELNFREAIRRHNMQIEILDIVETLI